VKVWAEFMWLIIGTGATVHALCLTWNLVCFVVTKICIYWLPFGLFVKDMAVKLLG
jgi:hypothetical protein